MTVMTLLIPITAIIGGFAIVLFNIYQRGRMRELRYRERMAMIERGMAPPSELATGGTEGPHGVDYRLRRGRHGSAGVMLIGIGFGLMLIIGFAGREPGSAVGVGGAIVVLGVAFLVNSWFCCGPGSTPPPGPEPSTPTPGAPPDQPPPPLP